MAYNPNFTIASKNRRSSAFYDLSNEKDINLMERDSKRLKNIVRSNINLMFDGYPSLDSKILIQGVLKDWTLKCRNFEDDSYVEDLDSFSTDLRTLRAWTFSYKENFSSILDEFTRNAENFVSRWEGLVPKILLKIRQRKGYYFLSFFLRLSDYYSLLGYEEQLHALKHGGYLRKRQLKPIVLIDKQDWREVLKGIPLIRGMRTFKSSNLTPLTRRLSLNLYL